MVETENCKSPTTNLEDIRELLTKQGQKLTPVNIDIVGGVPGALPRADERHSVSDTGSVAKAAGRLSRTPRCVSI